MIIFDGDHGSSAGQLPAKADLRRGLPRRNMGRGRRIYREVLSLQHALVHVSGGSREKRLRRAYSRMLWELLCLSATARILEVEKERMIKKNKNVIRFYCRTGRKNVISFYNS